jgi:hypothetical protein
MILSVKKLLISALISLMFISTGSAQIYCGISSGYGLPLAKQMLEVDYISGSTGDFVFGGLEGSLGKGFTNSFFAGYQFGAHFRFELGAEKLSGAKIKSSVVDTFDYGSTYTIGRSMKAKMINIIPGVRFTVGEKKFRSYFGMGMLIGFNGEINSERDQTSEYSFGGPSKYDQTEIFTGGIAWGFLGRVGVSYSLNHYISFLAEGTIHAQTWSPDKSKYTKCTHNWVDQLSSFPVSAKEFEYHRNVSYNFPYQNSSAPSILNRQYFPFSSYGLTLGVQVLLDFSKHASNNLPE